MNNPEKEVFFALLKKAMFGMTTEYALDGVDLKWLFSAFLSHDLLHLFGDFFEKNFFETHPELVKKAKKAQMTAIYRHLMQESELERITKTLEESEIPFMPLKGSIIRAYYPESWMRTSCDIDILVHEDDAERVSEVLCSSCAYTYEKRMTHDISLYSQTGVHLELHFRIGDNEKISSAFSHVWEDACVKEGTRFHYGMDNDTFVAYHVAHMAEHFVHGGCGVRPFLDLWIATNKMGYNSDRVRELLAIANLVPFYEAVLTLYNVWLENGMHTELTREMEDYILSSGIYGTTENRVAIAQANKGGKLRYVLGRIFLPYSRLILYYPNLKKHPILYPFYQVKRWFRIVFTKDRKNAITEIRLNSSVSEEKTARLHTMCEELSLL